MICLGELVELSSSPSMQKNCAMQLQNNRKRTTAFENQAPTQKKADAISMKEAKIKTAAPAIKTCESYFTWIANTNGPKELFSSFLNALKL